MSDRVKLGQLAEDKVKQSQKSQTESLRILWIHIYSYIMIQSHSGFDRVLFHHTELNRHRVIQGHADPTSVE